MKRHLNRREFLISGATLTGMGLPALGWAAAPCPPPSVSVSGGTTSSTECVSETRALPVLRVNGAGSSHAWTFGHAFAKGDVPAGMFLTAAGAKAFQADVRNWWINPDGSRHSVKFAVLSGIGGSNIQLGVTSSAPTGAPLTEAKLVAALPETRIQVGGHVTNVNGLIGTGAKHRTIVEGPVMSNWIYRQSATVGRDLVVWVDVRFYANGQIEIFPWVENGYLRTSSPTNFVGACSVSIGGAVPFSKSVDFKAFTRTPLLSGSTFAYWVGGDGGVTPQHDTEYLRATKLLPNYGWGAPKDSFLNGRVQTYTPGSLAGLNSSMGAAGGEGSANHPSTVLYITSGGDPRAYRAAMAVGLSSGSWSIHYRDATTQEPFKFSSYPNMSYNNQPPAAPSGGTNGTAATSHLPGFAFIPYLITGRWFFADEIFFWNNHNYLDMQNASRFGADSVHDSATAGSERRAAWALNTLAHALLIAPEEHPLRSDLIHAWEANCAYYRAKYVDGTSYKTMAFGKANVSPQGWFGLYGTESPYGTPGGVNAWFDAGWMSNYLVAVWGLTSDYELPISASARADHIAVRNSGYRQVIGRAGDGSAYNWRRFIVYDYPVAADSSGQPVETWYTFAQSYAAYCAARSLDPKLPATEGATLKVAGSDADLQYGVSSLPYGASGVMALALAKDHGAPGAVDAWRRISTASNFRSSFEPYFTGETPAFGVLPRS